MEASQEHCEIITEDNGDIHAVSPRLSVTATADVNPRMFNRNGLRKNLRGPKAGTTEHIRWLVVRAGMTNIYVAMKSDGSTRIVVTQEDLYP